ncbi:MAG TPA: DUF3551 domain-containing protein [Pseudolabrys sp.]|nr:DUF3551 domain-containing protein [Pseudolabrys sp.]
MRWTGLAAATAIAFALAPMLAPAAHADPYRWCAIYGGRDGGGGTNCGFVTFRQCQETISGIGGTCEPNPDYNGRPFRDEYSAPRHYPRYRGGYR